MASVPSLTPITGLVPSFLHVRPALVASCHNLPDAAAGSLLCRVSSFPLTFVLQFQCNLQSATYRTHIT